MVKKPKDVSPAAVAKPGASRGVIRGARRQIAVTFPPATVEVRWMGSNASLSQ